MKLAMSDWKCAFIAALILLALAAFILVVIHPGGFEGQIAWFFGFLPGAFVAASVAGQWAHRTPLLASIMLWPFILCVSFIWYFAISYAVIRACRLVFKRSTHSR